MIIAFIVGLILVILILFIYCAIRVASEAERREEKWKF